MAYLLYIPAPILNVLKGRTSHESSPILVGSSIYRQDGAWLKAAQVEDSTAPVALSSIIILKQAASA